MVDRSAGPSMCQPHPPVQHLTAVNGDITVGSYAADLGWRCLPKRATWGILRRLTPFENPRSVVAGGFGCVRTKAEESGMFGDRSACHMDVVDPTEAWLAATHKCRYVRCDKSVLIVAWDMIRAFGEGDLKELLDVWYRASLIAHSFLSHDFLAAERREIADVWIPMAETMIYEADGRVVGFLALIDNEVGGVFVDPDYQRRGIGRSLMDRARESRPYLELNVFEANAIGRRFYDAYGFDLVDRHIHEASGQPELHLRLG